MRRFGRWAGLAGALGMAGATVVATHGAEARERTDGDKSATTVIVQAHTSFACDLYGRLRTQPGNVVFSPHSISTALWMTSEGARGDTFAEMWRVLYRGKSLDADAHAVLIDALAPRPRRDGPSYRLAVANALWGSDDLAFERPFTDLLESRYRAPLERVDFTKPDSVRKRVNDWVAERTADKIRDIVPEGVPSPDTRLMLANAIHFKADWRLPFEKQWTKDEPFHTAGGAAVTVPLMHRHDEMPHGESETARFVDLALAENETALTIVLPRDGHSLAEVEEQLSTDVLESWLGALRSKDVDLRLPRFSIASGFELSPVLAELGMKRAFQAGVADFSGITRDAPLVIGEVAHRATMDVDEAGVEATAVTLVMMPTGAAMPQDTVDFRVDRPFLFVLRHTGTREVLFMGRVDDPTASD